METFEIKTGNTIYEIIYCGELTVFEYTVRYVEFTGESYVLPFKFIGKNEFFSHDFGTVLFFDFNEAQKKLKIIKEAQAYGNKNNNKLFKFFIKN